MTSFGGDDVFVSKLDVSGNFIWAKRIGGPGGDYAESIAVDVVGNVYSTGYFDGTADFDPDVAVLNFTSSGWTDIYIHKMSQTSVGIQENTNKNSISIYPNPTTGKFFIQSEKAITTEIHNVLGERIQVEAENKVIDLSKYAKGLYFVHCTDEKGNRSIFKLIRE